MELFPRIFFAVLVAAVACPKARNCHEPVILRD
jgi:hypothetical protein